MRDPERIPVFLEELSKLWKAHPELRFGQLMGVIYDDTPDPFYIEDDITLDQIRKKIIKLARTEYN